MTMEILKSAYMTYQRLFELKFKECISTHELSRRYPREVKKISRIALLELPGKELLELVKRERELKRLLNLKELFLSKERLSRSN